MTIQQPGLVSVIVPSFNHKSYIEDTIRSVLAQTYAGVELIVIDDGSLDGSAEFLRELSSELDFNLILQENRGVCATLNRAIREKAQGQWIALLGSDDLWHPEKLALQMQALRDRPDCAFAYSRAIEFPDGASHEVGRTFPKRVGSGPHLHRVFLRQNVPAGTMVFSRELYDSLGGFDESLGEEDWDWVIRCAAATPFAAVDDPLLYYRAHQGNTMRTRDPKAIFRDKAVILSKNLELVPAWLWLSATLVHFTYNILALPSMRWLRAFRSKEGMKP